MLADVCIVAAGAAGSEDDALDCAMLETDDLENDWLFWPSLAVSMVPEVSVDCSGTTDEAIAGFPLCEVDRVLEKGVVCALLIAIMLEGADVRVAELVDIVLGETADNMEVSAELMLASEAVLNELTCVWVVSIELPLPLGALDELALVEALSIELTSETVLDELTCVEVLSTELVAASGTVLELDDIGSVSVKFEELAEALVVVGLVIV